MSDLEQVIQKQIRTCRKYVSPLNNPALVRSYEIEIKTLINAPRTERELASAICRVKAKMQMTIDTVDLEPMSSELEALEWLIPIVKKYSDEKTSACQQ
jgi:hypothetical protein